MRFPEQHEFISRIKSLKKVDFIEKMIFIVIRLMSFLVIFFLIFIMTELKYILYHIIQF